MFGGIRTSTIATSGRFSGSPQEAGSILDCRHHLAVDLGQQPYETLAEQHRVIGHHHAHGTRLSHPVQRVMHSSSWQLRNCRGQLRGATRREDTVNVPSTPARRSARPARP